MARSVEDRTDRDQLQPDPKTQSDRPCAQAGSSWAVGWVPREYEVRDSALRGGVSETVSVSSAGARVSVGGARVEQSLTRKAGRSLSTRYIGESCPIPTLASIVLPV